MDSISYNFAMEDQKPIFTTASETIKATTTTETFTPSDNRNMSNQTDSVFSPLAAQFQCRGGNELLAMMAQQEPRQADTAPTQAEVDLMNFRMNGGSDLLFDNNMDQNSSHNFYMGNNNSRPESVASNMWSDGTGSGMSSSRSGEMNETFDFLVKSLSSANNYVSMLTREQLSVLRSIRPSLLYEFLQEVAKVRGDKRMRRALPNECAFCKNNGENEECYSSHALKDWRGRVLCPVLRAFRCPRCGATGDRAHTIKYCPDNADSAASERAGLSGRRRATATSLLLGGGGGLSANMGGGLSANMRGQHAPAAAPSHSPSPATLATPSASPVPTPSPASAALSHVSLWGSFGMN